ncbi:transporter [Sphingomonas oryzagri]
MTGIRFVAALGLLIGLTEAAHAEERDLCIDRPGKATPSCTLDAGHFQIEAGLFDYAHSRDSETVEDDYSTSDLLLVYGVNDSLEARIGWDGYGWNSARDRMTGLIDRTRGAGDLTLSFRQNLQHPDGKGTAFAILPSVTLPVGNNPIGAGTWSAGVVLPFNADLTENWQLTLDPEFDAAADSDRHGRHFAYALAAAVTRSLGEAWQLSAEGWAMRDDDPSGHATQASIDFSAAWQPDKNRQVDLSAYVGATHATPAIELVFGVAQRF